MAIEKKIDCVILGLLSHEDLTGYEIKKRMDASLKYFWGASYGSIYPALSDLVKNGMAVKRDETENNRNKIIYSITQKGRCHLKDWLRLPAEKDELRYETLLKLFFGNEAGALQAISHIDAFEEKIVKDLQHLTDSADVLRKNISSDDTHKYYLLTAEFGIKTYSAYLEWCREAKTMLKKER